MQKTVLIKYISLPLLAFTAASIAVETSFKGLVDLRAYHVDSNGADSYLKGDFGKFRYDDGTSVAIGQLAGQLHLDWKNNWSATFVGNVFADKGNEAIGITEAYLHYKGLPSENGWRMQSKIGIFYPAISLENVATAWSTPYTLTSSSLNNWVGEEMRNTGVNFSVEKLGKFSGSNHSFSADISLIQDNDPAGAMITWHGWTLGSRQTLMQERLKLPYFPARKTELSDQAAESDPFLELDDRWGVHVAANWRYKNKARFNVGYYDNHAEEGVVVDGQYTWTTTFTHAGLKYKPAKQWEVIAQHMTGRTYMVSPYGERVVDGGFDNSFVMLRHFWAQHHLALRLEHFSVDDYDDLWGDNNNETGDAVSLAYRYQLNRRNFLLTEYNWVDSNRPARIYVGQQEDLIERQIQIGYRHYF